MKINMDNCPPRVRTGRDVELGNVYQTQKGTLYVIIAIHERDGITGDQGIALCVDRDGEVINAVSYGIHYFSNRKLVGRATNLPDFVEIDWN